MSPDDSSSSAEQSLGRQSNYAEILDSEEGVREKDRRVELWGRMWGDGDLALAFYLFLDARNRTIETMRLVVVGETDEIRRFDPRVEPSQFDLRLKEFHVQSSSLPQNLQQEVEQSFRHYVEEEASLHSLERSLLNQKQSILEEWVENLAGSVIDEGTPRYQVQGRLVKDRSRPEGSSSTQPEPDGTEAGKPEAHEAGEDESEQRETFPVQIITRPMKGVPAVELEKGINIVARVMGEKVNELPEKWVDDSEDPPVSIPIETAVRGIHPNPSLPSDFKGVPSDYVRITVDLAEGMDGEGYVYKQDQIKVVTEDSEDDTKTNHVWQLIVSLVSLVLVVVLLFWTIS